MCQYFLPLYVYITFCLSVHLLVEMIGLLQLLAIVNNSALNKYCFKILLLTILGTYPEVALLDHMVILFLIF